MPSRLGIVGIVLFWLATTAFVVNRDVVPRLLAGGAPPLRIDIADEATQAVPVRWSVYRGPAKVGSLYTRMEYVPADDTFWFTSNYRDLAFDFGSVSVVVSEMQNAVRVTRTGDLREQNMAGKLALKIGGVVLATATADVAATVTDGVLNGHCKVTSPLGKVDKPLDPTPVPGGQVLNPMMPVNRLRDVRPGKRWVVRENDPLREAMAAAFRDVAKQGGQVAALAAGGAANRELLAEVLAEPESVSVKGTETPCWVIAYRGEEIAARTWVSVADGRVLRQEASGMGEVLRFEREE